MADNKPPTSGIAAVAIVGLGIAAIVGLTAIVINKYETAADAVSVLTVVVGPLAGIAAAAFGVKLSADAKNETKDVKQEAGAAADEIRGLMEEGRGQRLLADTDAATLTNVEQRLRRISR